MTTPPSDRPTQGLGPVRAELLRAAHADEQAVLARAEREAAALLDRARAEAREILDEARRQGEADGAAAARDLLVRARRKARFRTLTTRREAYETLRRETAERVGELRRTTDYPSLCKRLEQRARVLLGPGTAVTEHPGGGVIAAAPGRRVDLSLATLADRALDRMGREVGTLWEP
ncbi:hypothetical protein [Streptomyces sp. NPDC002265]|uniref:hypothetical protein n=1 Tax=Streptomyces sp. NPDC002265 TaxID=3154415 RepID=UPI00332995B3